MQAAYEKTYEKRHEKNGYVFIETFGCQMNDNDTMRMLGFLRGSDYVPTDIPEKADIILINSCSIREKAEQKLFSTVGRFRKLKNRNPNLIIGISGCVAQQEEAELLKKIPYLDMVVGTHNIHRLPSLVREIKEVKRPVVSTGFSSEITPDEFPAPFPGAVKAMVSIMRGCDNYCAYCIVPYVRGREQSRSTEAVLSEVKALALSGTKEVTLIGQNVNSYKAEVGFPGLLKLAAKIDGIERIRFVTSHPKDISKELIRLFGEEGKIGRNVHLPIQSGSDKILERMRRGYTVGDYMEKAKLFRKLYPDISITTDIIVGFPGETEEDFSMTMKVVDEAEFDGIFSFKYSPREKTLAATFPDHIQDGIKQKRLEMLQSRQKEIAARKNRGLVGKRLRVLVEGRSKNSDREFTGRTACGRVVNFPGSGELAGSMVDVLITEGYVNSLTGATCDDRDDGNRSCN